MPFAKDRNRRIIYNDDAYQQTDQSAHHGWYRITDEGSFIDARTTPTFDTHVDTYVWCVGNGADPPWGPFGQKYRGPVWHVLGSSARAANLIVEACHAEGMEVWGSLRMNDLHDCIYDLEETNDALKAQHPEYLIGKEEDRHLPQARIERYLRTAFNFERPEVRRHRLDFIQRNASAHDFDGYELDFTRFIWNFPQGRERELAPLMTDLVRQVRSTLSAIGHERGRPYTLAVHVVDSLETSLDLGLDVETWLSEGLVDVLVVGMGSMPFAIRLDQWNTLGQRYGVPIYPSLNTRHLSWLYKERMLPVSALHEYMRGAAAWWWHNSADGVYLFNVFTHEDVWGLERKHVYAPLEDIGEPAQLKGKDKLYDIEPLASVGMFSQGSEGASLPVPLDIHERRLPLAMGPDAGDPSARFKIHMWTSGGSAGTRVWMRLNHTLLEPVRQGDHCWAEVPAGVMRAERNDLAVFCDTDLAETANPIIVDNVLASEVY